MADQPAIEKPFGNPKQLASTLRNLTTVVLVTAALNIVGQGGATEKEVFRNLEGGVAAWLVCGLLLLIGVAIIGGAIAKANGHRTAGSGYEPSSKTQLVLMFIVLIFAGVVGASVARSFYWQLEWTAGFYLEGTSQVWPEVQAWIGWALATSLVFTVWAMTAQILAERRKS